jgi:Uma2 family endonuclease
MTVHAPVTMTKEAFLAWVEQREERYELAGGRVVMMVRITWNHAVVTSNLLVALKTRLRREEYDAVSEAFAVDVRDSLRFPDILVQRRPKDGKALEASEPILIAEVLSPGTQHIDFGDKFREYMSLPTLEIYMIVSPDEPSVWLWQRAGGDFPQNPEIYEKLHQRFSLPALQVEIPLAELYQGVS